MKGILFKPWKINYIAEHPDLELQTRRVIKPQPFLRDNNWWCWLPKKNTEVQWHEIYDQKMITDYARYQVGETVYIKEAWATEEKWDNKSPSFLNNAGDVPLWYRADYSPSTRAIGGKLDYVSRGRWRSPMMMPEWAARYFIKILGNEAEILSFPLSPQELLMEGGEQALPILEKIKGLWVWVYTFRLESEGL